MNIKLTDLTLVGWLLTFATIGLIVVLMIYSGRIWHEILPGGRYPALLLAAPGLLVGILFFGIGWAALQAMGIPVVKVSVPAQVDSRALDRLPVEVRSLGEPITVFAVPTLTKVAQLAGLGFVGLVGLAGSVLLGWLAIQALTNRQFLLPISLSCAALVLLLSLAWLARRTWRIVNKRVLVGQKGLAVLEAGTPLVIPWGAITKTRYESDPGSETFTIIIWYGEEDELVIPGTIKSLADLASVVEANRLRRS